MPDANDMDLVREFARHNSDAAFTELVRRHLNLVYSVARRCTGNDGDAHDVAQAVFIILARKAAGLREKTLLTGWLYETTRFAAARLLRTNARRHAREQEAYMQSILNDPSRHSAATAEAAEIWTQLSPHLEAAMDKLNAADRALLVLRFYENKTGPETAALLGIREDAAHKRVARALEKLRKIFMKRGVTLTATAIAGAVSANSVQAAPVALVKTISAIAVAKGATASTLTLAKGTLKIMAWQKAKMVIVIGVGVFLIAGITTIVGNGKEKSPTYQAGDLVGFFKSAINSTPDIEHIVFIEQLLGHPGMPPAQLASLAAHGVDLNKLPPPQFFEGARAGNNFFLSAIVNSNDVPKAMETGPVQINVDSRFVYGRAGNNSYQVGMKELLTTTDPNSETHNNNMARESQSSFEFFNQVVQMGIGGLKERTAVWVNNELTAEREGYPSIHGELVTSNNLPIILTVSSANAFEPFERFYYSYPDPPDSLGGFPEKITRFVLVNGEEQPAEEYDILQIRLAQHPLSESYFATARFITTNITFTYLLTNGVSYAILPNGKLQKNNPPKIK